MVKVIENLDGFDESKITGSRDLAGTWTFQNYLEKFHPDHETYEPFVLKIGGEYIPREEWPHRILEGGERVRMIGVVGLVETLIGLAVALVVSVVAVAIIPKPSIPTPRKVKTPDAPAPSFVASYTSAGQTPEADPVFSLRGQRNQFRLQQPIEVSYGQFRLFPSYAATPYNGYSEGRYQFQYSLFSLGQGLFDVSQYRIEDTPIENFEDVEHELYEPGEPPLLFSSNVETSPEVGSIELFGPNEPEYPDGDGYSGPYTANEAFTRVNKLEFDISHPNGLYEQTEFGDFLSKTIVASFEYRAIDDSGVAIGDGDWIVGQAYSKKASNINTLRYTLQVTVPMGRYEVRARRTNNASSSARVADTLIWEALRAFQPDTNDYGSVTLWAVKALASNNLNDSSSSRFNLVATRKLPVYSYDSEGVGSWSDPVPTRNPIWAFCDAALNTVYGGGASLSVDQLDMETLVGLAETFDAENIHFDWTFDQRSTLWDVLSVIARSCFCTLVFESSRMSLKRDVPASVPTDLFNQHNMVKDSFRWEIALATEDDGDGIVVEYTDPTTWKSETVDCFLDDDTGVNADKIKAVGITDRDRAYQYGMRLRRVQRYNRENVVFKTEAEGVIPSYGDLVAVGHEIARWGSGGEVEGIDAENNTVSLSDGYEFKEDGAPVIILKDRYGNAVGPMAIEPGDDARTVRVPGGIPGDYYLSGDGIPPYYLIGDTEEFYSVGKVTDQDPGDDDTVDLTVSLYDERIYLDDDSPAPARTSSDGSTLEIATAPAIGGLNVAPAAGSITEVVVSWNAALGASVYTIETSPDGVDYTPKASTEEVTYTLPVSPGDLWVRVAAVNQRRGPWSYWDGPVGVATVLPLPVTTLNLTGNAWEGAEVSIDWKAPTGADNYAVTVKNTSGGSVRRTFETTQTTAKYTRSQSDFDGTPTRSLTFEVTSKNDIGDADMVATLNVANDAPSAVTGITQELLSSSSAEILYKINFNPSPVQDLGGYKIWASATGGFTPAPGNEVYEGPVSEFTIAIASPGNNGQHPALYFRVAAFDAWGNDVAATSPPDIVLSGEQTIPAKTS